MLCLLLELLDGLSNDGSWTAFVPEKFESGDEASEAKVGTDDRESFRTEPCRRGGGGAGLLEVIGTEDGVTSASSRMGDDDCVSAINDLGRLWPSLLEGGGAGGFFFWISGLRVATSEAGSCAADDHLDVS